MRFAFINDPAQGKFLQPSTPHEKEIRFKICLL